MIEVRNLTIAIGDGTLLKDVSFSAGPGISSLIDPGHFKGRELLRALARLRPIQAGSFYWLGNEATRMSPLALADAGICYIERHGALMGDMTVDATIALGRPGSSEERSSAVDDTMDCFPQLRAYRTAPTGALGAHDAFTVALARGLSAGGRLFLLDGPADGTDDETKSKVVEVIKGLARQPNVGIILAGSVVDAMPARSICLD